jgi:hypothetical protein
MNVRQLVVVAAFLAVACSVRNPLAPERSPEWLTSLIQQLEAQAVANPPALIARYDYRGDVAYYLPARCCDIPSTLYQADGTILCHPDGGFAGRGDGRCPAFFAERRNERIIWRDPRGAP